MTGYAFIEKSTEQFSFSVELKSLNSKHLEVYVNLPRILKNDEIQLQGLLKERFSRGKIEFNIDLYDWVSSKPISLNLDLIRKYYAELRKVHGEMKIKEPLRFESVLAIEGVTHRERSSISPKSRKAIYSAIELVIKKTISMRKKEGEAIRKDIMKSVTAISGKASVIARLSKNSSIEKRESLKKKLEDLSAGSIDDHRVYAELAILADKLDINEEIMRLDDHISKFRNVINDRDQLGRKLDFLAQEMFREINTIASKSSNSEISHLVVEMKNHVDKIREHFRNVV